jgi:NTE family protein
MSRALVVSGGGSKGAYAVGVAKVLKEAGIDFDMFCGTSTGGLVTPFLTVGRVDLAETFYTTVKTKDILEYRTASQILKAPSFADFGPLYNKLQEAIDEIGMDLLTSSKRMFITTTRLQDRSSVFFHNLDAPPGLEGLNLEKITDTDTLRRAMLATASMPGFAEPVKIKNPQGKTYQHVDGGVRENTPLMVPVALGVEEIYVILLSPQGSPIQDVEYKTLPAVIGRTADALTTDVSEHDISAVTQARELKKLFDGVAASISHDTPLTGQQVRDALAAANPKLAALANTKFTLIGPAEPLTDNVLDFSPKKMKEMLAQGVVDARAVLDSGGVA